MAGPTEWIILFLVVTVLLSWKKIPDMSRTVGRAMRSFRSGLRGLSDRDIRSKASAQIRRGKLGARHDPEDQR